MNWKLMPGVCALLSLPVATTGWAQEAEDAGMEVEAAIALGVEDRAPVDSGMEFPADVGMLYGWTSITGASGTTVQHVWVHGENEWAVDIDVGGSPWRVWSTKNIPAEWTGEWTFEVRSEAGDVVQTTSFTVGGGDGDM